MLARLAVVLVAIVVAPSAFAQSQGEWIADPKSGCKVWNSSPKPNEAVTWTGKCVNGFAQGPGAVHWYKDGKPNQKVEGAYRDGRLTGRVTIAKANGERYEGDSIDGQANGHGIFYYTNGARYDGEWRDGRRDGHGILYPAEGGSFDGMWRDGLPNGSGTFKLMNGEIYSGTWTNGCFKQGVSIAWVGTNKEACGLK
jgi:hypothetical protein